jgi:imidazoleglycerol-phosphate dehydratase
VSTLTRQTGETRVRLTLRRGDRTLAPPPAGDIVTGDGFLDHMLATLARYAGLHLAVEASGDLRHHLVEDVAISLGLALRAETPQACRRYGAALVPMDDALVQVAVDLGGRAWYEGALPDPLAEHALRSLAVNAAMTLHVVVLRGADRHHVVEAAVKGLGLALREALEPAGDAVFSTKGAVRIDWEAEP